MGRNAATKAHCCSQIGSANDSKACYCANGHFARSEIAFSLNRWCSCHIRMFEFDFGIWRQTTFVDGINRIVREFLGLFVGGNALDFEPSRCRWSTGPCFEPLLRQWTKLGFVPARQTDVSVTFFLTSFCSKVPQGHTRTGSPTM